MSDKLKDLQDAAIAARAKATELEAALTDKSSPKELKAAEDAEQEAVKAEEALAVATAKADGAGSSEPTPAEREAAAQQGETAQGIAPATEADESRTGYADARSRAGDPCICPDGRKGTVHQFDAGLICIPNADQE